MRGGVVQKLPKAFDAIGGRIGKALRVRFPTLGRDRRGNAAIIFASALLPMVGVAGVATDGLLGYLVRDQMQAALDAATLAAGRVVATAAFESDARRFFAAHLEPGYLDAPITPFALTPAAGPENMTTTTSDKARGGK